LVWACYHTDLWETTIDDVRIGVVGCAVGAPFAVRVAEQLFASGCRLLISITSAGQIAADLDLPCFILIDRALRGEETSHCYLPPEEDVTADPTLIAAVARGIGLISRGNRSCASRRRFPRRRFSRAPTPRSKPALPVGRGPRVRRAANR